MISKPLPKPKCEFEFELPRGIDADYDAVPFSLNDPDLDAVRVFNEAHDRSKQDDDYDSVSSTSSRIPSPLHYNKLGAELSGDEGGGYTNLLRHRARRSTRKSVDTYRKPKEILSRTGIHDDNDGGTGIDAKANTQYRSLFGSPIKDGPEDSVLQSKTQVKPSIGSEAPWQGMQHGLSYMNKYQESDRDGILSSSPRDCGLRDDGSLFDEQCSVLSEQSSTILPENQNIDRKVMSTFVDTDRSGNFDPIEATKRRRSKSSGTKTAKSTIKKGREKTNEPVEKQHIMKCIVRLPIDAVGSMRNITNDEDNWPDDWSDLDSECERERELRRIMYRHSTPGNVKQDPVPDPADDVDDLTGYPAARGCRACRELKQDCSTVKTSTYPCEQCEENSQYCRLIVEPLKKGKCQQCLDKGARYCSMEEDPSEMICQSCEDKNESCNPLPPYGYKSGRISLDEILYGPDRPFKCCTYCRQHKLKCSLQRNFTKPPCKHCRQHDFGCTFYDLDYLNELKEAEQSRQESPKPLENLLETIAPNTMRPNAQMFSTADLVDLKKLGYDNRPVPSHETTHEEDWIDDVYGNVGTYTKINTTFAHPIQFNISAFAAADCNFCAMPYFGFVGHYEREVHVMRWQNGRGYTEIAAGHSEQNGATTMCRKCMLSRAYIVACPDHQMQYQHGNDEPPTFDEVFEELLKARGPEQVRDQLRYWCSLCFHPAAYKCCTQGSSLLGPQEERSMEGCGLLLCLQCEVSLREHFEGDSDAMATVMDAESKAKEGEELNEHSVRADVGFLMSDGMLMRALAFEIANGEAIIE